ncbi:Ig-like domain-containing protein, partial [Paenibacillus zanthoxyli]|uniref:Ig-like domain-containing protein n=1 Tax=Paenibacillus zanthoxyli TaxID=369399 RepID=UPI00055CA177
LRVVLNKSSLDVPAGGSVQAIASVLPYTAPQKLVWESSDGTVAKVVSDGGTTAVIKGIKEGQAEIKARTPDGKVYTVLSAFVYKP